MLVPLDKLAILELPGIDSPRLDPREVISACTLPQSLYTLYFGVCMGLTNFLDLYCNLLYG